MYDWYISPPPECDVTFTIYYHAPGTAVVKQAVPWNAPLGSWAPKSLAAEFEKERRAFAARRNRSLGVSGLAHEITRGVKARHPVSGREAFLYDIIVSLNDEAQWTREQIADWLDTLPNQPKWYYHES